MPRAAAAPDALKDPHDAFDAPEAFRVLQIVPLQNEADSLQRLIGGVMDQRLRVRWKGRFILFEMMHKNFLEKLHAHTLLAAYFTIVQ